MFTPAASIARPARAMLAAIEVEIGCTFEFETSRTTHAIVMVEPHPSESPAVLASSFRLDPASATATTYLDRFGNTCRHVDLAAGRVVLGFDALVEVTDRPDPDDWSAREVPPAELPSDALMFVLPSRYCESDLLVGEAFRRFGAVAPGWGRVQAICDWVHESMRFQYGTSSPTLSARRRVRVARRRVP